MKPYYQDDAVTIYHGDAFDVMPRIRDHGQCVDVVVTDPDYNAPDIGPNHRAYEGGQPHLSDEEYRAWCARWFQMAEGFTERIIFSSGIRNLWNYPAARWVIAWSKPSSVSFSGLGGYNVWEPILIYGKPANRIGHDLVTYNPLNFRREEWTKHPCPKHPELWKWLIEKVTDAGELILDPFMGSGTTLRAAKDLGRKAIGIEIEEKYCEIAANRMSQSVMSLEV